MRPLARTAPRWLTTLTLCSLASTLSFAATPTANAEEPAKRTRLERGAPAPFAGYLLTADELAKVVSEVERVRARGEALLRAERERAAAELKAERGKAAAELRAERGKREAADAALLRERAIYERALAPAPWYKSGYVPLSIGLLLGGGICAGSVAAAR